MNDIEESDLQAYVDGRLDAARRDRVERWLAERPTEAERLAAYGQIGQALHRHFDALLDEPVPDALRDSLRAAPRWKALRVAAWVAIGIAIGLFAGWQLRNWAPPTLWTDAEGPLPMRAAIAHLTYYTEVRHPVEVGADQEAHLVAWLSKRLGYKLRAPNLDAEGFSLVGGRLLPGDGSVLHTAAGSTPTPVAHFMYQCPNGRRITLYVQPEPAKHQETAFRYAREGNVSVFYWLDRDLGYALSSVDVGRDELLNVANSVYRQLNP
jgi:anti-sigma factor RsiW